MAIILNKMQKSFEIIPEAVRIISEHYQLGNLLHAEELHGGYCNRSFAVSVQKKGHPFKYLVRRYRPTTAEKEIKFEHALISHLIKNGFTLVAGLIASKTGDTYVKAQVSAGSRPAAAFWAVFDFLEGEDRYTWTDTDLSSGEITSAAKVLAHLHRASHNFCEPSGADRVQPKIMDFLPTFRQVYAEYGQKARQTGFDRCFLKHRDEISRTIDRLLIPKPVLNRMPQLPIHGDYHQGNLKYRNSRVIGVFDFDWSKIDLRLFDLALALIYFCASWEGPAAGSLNPDTYKLFLQAYSESCTAGVAPGVLTDLEKTWMPSMLAAANLFVLHWTIVDFYGADSPDDETYLKYINHGLRLKSWIEAQKGRLSNLTQQGCS